MTHIPRDMARQKKLPNVCRGLATAPQVSIRLEVNNKWSFPLTVTSTIKDAKRTGSTLFLPRIALRTRRTAGTLAVGE